MNQPPVAILVTFSKQMMDAQGGAAKFWRYFLKSMAEPDCLWLNKCTNLPRHDVAWVYIVVGNRIRCRANCVGYARGPAQITRADGSHHVIDWPRVTFTGPLIMAPGKLHRQGFQGFRYLPEQIF